MGKAWWLQASPEPRDGALPQLLPPEEILSIFWISPLEPELGWDAACHGTTHPEQLTLGNASIYSMKK